MTSTDPLPVTGNTEHTRPENRAFYPALDGLRAMAFFMVFGQHYLALPWGWSGVDLFFVLSGFLITGILYDTRNDPHRAKVFYMRRTLRIFPLYYGILLVMLVLAPLFDLRHQAGLLLWPAYLGNFARFLHHSTAANRWDFVSGFALRFKHPLYGHSTTLYLGHFWSLCVEEQFYLVWPWVVFGLANRRKLLWICLGSIPVCLALRLLAVHTAPQWIVAANITERFTPIRLDSLLWGGALALAIRGPHRDLWLRVTRWLLVPVLIWYTIALHTVPLMHPHRWQSYTYPRWTSGWSLAFTFVDFLSFLLIANALQIGTWVYRIFSWRLLRWIGRLTYGLYVFHEIPHDLYYALAMKLYPRRSLSTTVIVALACTFALAWLSYRFFESPFLNLKRRWTEPPSPRAAVTETVTT